MARKYILAKSRDQISDRFNVQVNSSYKPIYNGYPGMRLPVITNEAPDTLEYFQWGMIPYDSVDPMIGEKLLHAKYELLKGKRPFADLITTKRCLIPADGFIIWSDGDAPAPFLVKLKSKETFAIAGIWDSWIDEFDDTIRFSSFTMITMNATDSIRNTQDRIPAIVLPEFERQWLDNSLSQTEILGTIKTIPDDFFEISAIGDDIMTSDENDQNLIKTLNSHNPGESYSLF